MDLGLKTFVRSDDEPSEGREVCPADSKREFQMSAKLKHQAPESAGNNVIPLSKCRAEGCTKKGDRAEFCPEHYEWFKFGLITKEGKRPTDFDKKYQAFKKHKAA